jgi:hypothetical protein
LKASGAFVPLFATGRFEVLHWREYAGEWANRLVDGQAVTGIDFDPGRISIPLGGAAVAQGILLKTSFHPYWRLSPESGAALTPHPSGLMEIKGLQGGMQDLELEFRPPVWPKFVSLLAVLGIVAMALGSRFSRKKAGP